MQNREGARPRARAPKYTPPRAPRHVEDIRTAADHLWENGHPGVAHMLIDIADGKWSLVDESLAQVVPLSHADGMRVIA